MSPILVHVAETRGVEDVRYDIHFEYEQIGGSTTGGNVWYVVKGNTLPGSVEVLDFAVLSLLFMAMRLGRDLRIRGPVSRRLLANLEEFQSVWRLWAPAEYQAIEIIPDQEIDTAPIRKRGAIAAFSGGVDAAFTILRHSQGLAGRRSQNVAAALLVHGFDIPASNVDAFNTVQESAQRALSTIGVPLSVVTTNWREAVGKDWEAEFGCGLAACLHLFREHAGAGLIGSDEDYAHLAFPWGSNPVTNWLLSSGDFEIVYDGGGFTRSEKVRLIAEWTAFRDNLRVCWEGPRTGANCGRCEKCLRTQMNFLAVGQSPGRAFPLSMPSSSILRLTARNRVQLGYLKEISDTARKNGMRSPWVRHLSLCIARNELLLASRQVLRHVPGLRSAYRRVKAL